jgi:riboflavin synthase
LIITIQSVEQAANFWAAIGFGTQPHMVCIALVMMMMMTMTTMITIMVKENENADDNDNDVIAQTLLLMMKTLVATVMIT